MAAVLHSITKLIQSLPGQLAAGGVLAGIVWKFFERVEAVLTDNTKLEIAVWLLGVKVGQKVEPWPETFAKVFDRVFGTKHLSWSFFMRSFLASYGNAALILVPLKSVGRITTEDMIGFISLGPLATAIPDYLSLLKTRLALGKLTERPSAAKHIKILLMDAVLTALCGVGGVVAVVSFIFVMIRVSGAPYSGSLVSHIGDSLREITSGRIEFFAAYFYAAFFSSVWLWLYVGSGLLLKAARRFDIALAGSTGTLTSRRSHYNPLASLRLGSWLLFIGWWWRSTG